MSRFRKNRKSSTYVDEEEEDTAAKKRVFRAVIDKNTSLLIKDHPSRMIFIMKKDLIDYKIHVFASEAPVSNYILNDQVIEFETIVADRTILEKEVFPFHDKVSRILKKNLTLRSVQLCIGREEDFITIDEKDLSNVDIKPSIQGLKEFMLTNRSVIGLGVRRFDTKKGNLVFLEAKYEHTFDRTEIKSVRMKILSSLQQRGLYMQKYHRPFGLQMYTIINVRKTNQEISPETVDIINRLGVPLENILLRRSLMISNWRAIECEITEMNLRNYLQNQFPKLSHSDVHQIGKFSMKNELGFEIAVKMAEILSKSKEERYQKKDYGSKVLNLGEITAAGMVAAEFHGIQGVHIEKHLNQKRLKEYYDEFNEYI